MTVRLLITMDISYQNRFILTKVMDKEIKKIFCFPMYACMLRCIYSYKFHNGIPILYIKCSLEVLKARRRSRFVTLSFSNLKIGYNNLKWLHASEIITHQVGHIHYIHDVTARKCRTFIVQLQLQFPHVLRIQN